MPQYPDAWRDLDSRYFTLWITGAIAVVALILIGLNMQLALARTNLDMSSQTNKTTPDVLAGEWIHSHTEQNAIVMARHIPIVYHYAERNMVWFPPSSNPQLLMEGIQKHKIDFVVVITRDNSYYLPPEEDCMAALLLAYPNAFEVVNQTSEFKIYRTLKNGESSHIGTSGFLP